jgi:hypothetical protein
MKCAVEMGSGAMIYIPNFLKYCFRHSKVNRGEGWGFTDTQAAWISQKSALGNYAEKKRN